MDWIGANWQEIILVALAAVEIAKRIVKWTATTKDDAVVDKVSAWLKMVAFLAGKKLKENGK